MKDSTVHRARRLAFALGAAAIVLEMLVLLAVSHACAPEGQLLAGSSHSAPAGTPDSPAVILMRQLEISL